MGDQQPQQGASIEELTQMAQRLGDLGRDGGPFNQVLRTAEDVKRHQRTIMQALSNIALLVNSSINTNQGLNQLREVLEQGQMNQDQFAAQLDGILRNAPRPEEINGVIEDVRTLARQQGVIPEQDIQNIFQTIPDPAWREQPLPPPPPPPGAVGGGSKRKYKKHGGYGWSGKKGVEVRSSIRTTRRSKAKKGKKTPSKKRTKKRSSGKK